LASIAGLLANSLDLRLCTNFLEYVKPQPEFGWLAESTYLLVAPASSTLGITELRSAT
jgi:hypothetical protein